MTADPTDVTAQCARGFVTTFLPLDRESETHAALESRRVHPIQHCAQYGGRLARVYTDARPASRKPGSLIRDSVRRGALGWLKMAEDGSL